MTSQTKRPVATGWPLERVLFAMAGTITVISAVLAAVVSPWFLLLTGLVGVNQWLYVGLRACPASIVLERTCGLSSSLYPRLYPRLYQSSPMTAPLEADQ